MYGWFGSRSDSRFGKEIGWVTIRYGWKFAADESVTEVAWSGLGDDKWIVDGFTECIVEDLAEVLALESSRVVGGMDEEWWLGGRYFIFGC